MAPHKITLLPGDGIGPEVTASVVAIIECTGVKVDWETYFVGSEALARFGDPLPQEVLPPDRRAGTDRVLPVRLRRNSGDRNPRR